MESLHATARRDFENARTVEREALEALESLGPSSRDDEALGRSHRARVNLEGEIAWKTGAGRSRRPRSTGRGAGTAQHPPGRLEGEETERQRAWEELEARRAAIEAERETARASWQQAASDLRAARERQQLLEKRQAAVAEALEAEVSSPVSQEELDRLELVATTARRAIEVIGRRLSELRERQAELRERAGETGVQRDAVRRRHEDARTRLENTRRRLGEIEVEETEIRVRRESTAEGLRRDADADEETALRVPRPDIEGVEPDADLEAVLEELEARLRRMGPVNPLAAQEYAELEERYTFLRDQLSDLEKSRDELERVIAAVDEEIQTRFVQAFEEVAAAYEQNFSVLFPGGVGRIRLTDPNEPLTTGVEIQAQPLGKKVSQLSLLSGGEGPCGARLPLRGVQGPAQPLLHPRRVEAALDDANLRRFLRLIDAFRGDAQLIIVTHQQQTMEAADVLYGVTMEPGGSRRSCARNSTPYRRRRVRNPSRHRIAPWNPSISSSSVAIIAVVLVVAGVGWFVPTVAAPKRRSPTPSHRPVLWPPGASPAESPRRPSHWGSASVGVQGGALDQEFWDSMEEVLIGADVGVAASTDIVARIRERRPESTEDARRFLREELEAELSGRERSLDVESKPAVVVVVGVNGTGKTTTIAKLANRLKADGKVPLLGAADTFRAAADAQLRTWGDRLGVDVVGGQEGADPAAVAFDALQAARSRGRDVVLIDTAGRLHSKHNLMAELGKIRRVLEREGPVDEVLLVLDATGGQNGISQAEVFAEAVGVTGIVLTKLDGTARGGVVVAVERLLGLPVKYVGVGEGLEDLIPFDPAEFVEALLADA